MSAFTGTGPLFKVALHHNARSIAPWVMLISVLSASSILGYRWIFPDVAERRALATALAANPALEIVFGPAGNLLTDDGFNAWRAGMLGAFFAGLMAIVVVVRTSRADEDSGQGELVASGVITRQARLLVAVLLAVVAAVALGVVCSVLTLAVGGGTAPTLVLAASFTASALLFAGVAAVAAQLGSDARTASSLAIGVLGLTYVVRGYLDSSNAAAWTQWLTPFGWLERTRVSVDNDPLPLLVPLVVALVLVAVALALQQHRDFGLGMISPRPGPAEAPRLRSWGLAWRVNRGQLLTWLVAFAFLGVVFGNLTASVGTVFADNPMMQQIIRATTADKGGMTFAYVTTVLQIVGIIAAVAGVQVAMRAAAEEQAFRAEPLLAAPLRRATHLAGQVLVGLLASAVGLVVAGVVIGVVASAGGADLSVSDVAVQAVATVPAVWLLVALSFALVGAAPRARLAGWLAVVATFGITLLGPTFKLSDTWLGLSPFHHVPVVAGSSVEWTGLVVVSLVAAALLVVAFVGYRRRDIG